MSATGRLAQRCLAIAALVIPALAAAQGNDCFAQAARYHGVNESVLRAIAWHESRFNNNAVRANRNGTYDIGAMQINSVHLPELAEYNIGLRELRDGCVAVFVGAWKYRKKINKFGNTWSAVGAYHSETPIHRDRYAAKIYQVLLRWGAFATGPAFSHRASNSIPPDSQRNSFPNN